MQHTARMFHFSRPGVLLYALYDACRGACADDSCLFEPLFEPGVAHQTFRLESTGECGVQEKASW